jgi:hypothetical protein
MKKSQLPGVTVRKSIRDALAAVKTEMERMHFDVVNREKAKALAVKKAGPKTPG